MDTIFKRIILIFFYSLIGGFIIDMVFKRLCYKRKLLKSIEKFDFNTILVIIFFGITNLILIFSSDDYFVIISYLILNAYLCLIFFMDFKFFIIPNKVVFMGITNFFIIKIIESFSVKDFCPIKECVFGFLFGGGIILAIIILSKGKMGAGDMKFLALIGCALGVKYSITIFIISIFMAAFVSLFLILLKFKTFKSNIPFGPFIVFSVYFNIYFNDLVVKFIRENYYEFW